MSPTKNVVLITGAAGWLGGLLSSAIIADPRTPDVSFILADIIDKLFTTGFGIPDTVYCLHGIMSRGSEDNFELGLKVNIDSIRMMLQATRKYGANLSAPIKFIFTSSLAVYGGPLPEVVTPDTIATPEGAYGMGKLTSELLVNEFTRRGFIDGRIIRLPTIVVRPGVPSAATSAFISGSFGVEALCPIGDSIDSPELQLAAWLASPETTIKNFELEALEKVAGKEALKLVSFKDDPINRRIVSSWPARFDNTYPLSLGFVVDEGGMVTIVEQFKKDIAAGIA
ncbi:hypothetical protein CPB85DRAFT_1493980 [Mucidula mucida]|nr:hypothetical protein CPB85DRAFT_1493980 [Mucidula mucida]